MADNETKAPEGADQSESLPEFVTVIVARGHTIQTPEGDFGAGAEVHLEYEEAKRLWHMGRVLEPEDVAEQEAAQTPAGVRMSSKEGVNVRVAA